MSVQGAASGQRKRHLHDLSRPYCPDSWVETQKTVGREHCLSDFGGVSTGGASILLAKRNLALRTQLPPYTWEECKETARALSVQAVEAYVSLSSVTG